MDSSKKKSRKRNRVTKRTAIPLAVKVAVLTECGYRCAVPTCRQILAIDLHHMVEVSAGGPNDPGNLLPLCPSCHALYHRGTIKPESIYVWKSIIISLSQAFDVVTIDHLLFLRHPRVAELIVSGDGVLQFARIIASGLATFKLDMRNGPLAAYAVQLTENGQKLVSAWVSGDRKSVETALGTQ